MSISSCVAHWRDVAHVVKRTLQGPGSVELAGTPFRVAYESRGAWTEHDYPILRALATGRRQVWDVGANKGMTSLLMASVLAPGGRVIAFEPSETACRVIRANAALNSLSETIQVVSAVVSDRSGQAVEFFGDEGSVTASAVRRPGDPTNTIQRVTLALDDFSAQAPPPDFIKIDVEGFERAVLRGLTATLTQARPLVFVEVHPVDGMDVAQHASVLGACANGYGYRLWSLRARQWFAKGLPDRMLRHVLLVPDGDAVPSLPRMPQ